VGQKKVPKSDHELYQGWVEKYGEEAAKVIKKTVDENVEHYEHLKQFAIKV
jgi:thiaminase